MGDDDREPLDTERRHRSEPRGGYVTWPEMTAYVAGELSVVHDAITRAADRLDKLVGSAEQRLTGAVTQHYERDHREENNSRHLSRALLVATASTVIEAVALAVALATHHA